MPNPLFLEVFSWQYLVIDDMLRKKKGSARCRISLLHLIFTYVVIVHHPLESTKHILAKSIQLVFISICFHQNNNKKMTHSSGSHKCAFGQSPNPIYHALSQPTAHHPYRTARSWMNVAFIQMTMFFCFALSNVNKLEKAVGCTSTLTTLTLTKRPVPSKQDKRLQ